MAATNDAALIVPAPSAVAITNDIRAIKPPVEIPNEWAWFWWVLTVVLVGAMLAVALRWWRKQKAQIPAVAMIPAHVRAKQRLHAALTLIHDPRLFCIEVSGVIRVYLEERFDFRAPERTTEEFLLELQATRLLTSDQKQSLGEFLQGCDLVKFARYEPTESALRQLHDSALRLVDETQFDPIGVVAASTMAPPAISLQPVENDEHRPSRFAS
jgi:hypothetical protein